MAQCSSLPGSRTNDFCKRYQTSGSGINVRSKIWPQANVCQIRLVIGLYIGLLFHTPKETPSLEVQSSEPQESFENVSLKPSPESSSAYMPKSCLGTAVSICNVQYGQIIKCIDTKYLQEYCQPMGGAGGRKGRK